ncbi:unnamed protein product [Ilex paraguariensis]|uniref:PI4-kinase N-terminal domain-containing protein n=1 Tax=Ilex paraguariensis TaxID=185542 RepID=A0ABC8SSX8_9AQUA
MRDTKWYRCTNDYWTGTKTANIPAVMAATAAALGANLKLTEAFNLECDHAGEIAGMRSLYESIGGLDSKPMLMGSGDKLDVPTLGSGVGEVDKSAFRETCSQATGFRSDLKSNVESFSQLLVLGFNFHADAMETGVFIWMSLVWVALQWGSLVLAGLTLIMGSQKCSLKGPVEQIMARRLWLSLIVLRVLTCWDVVESLGYASCGCGSTPVLLTIVFALLENISISNLAGLFISGTPDPYDQMLRLKSEEKPPEKRRKKKTRLQTTNGTYISQLIHHFLNELHLVYSAGEFVVSQNLSDYLMLSNNSSLLNHGIHKKR